jgi:hypothetical protein
MEAFLLWVKENSVLALGIACLLGGSTVWPIVKKIAAGTPNKVDDLLVDAVEGLARKEMVKVQVDSLQAQLGRLGAAEIEKWMPNRLLAEIVRLRRERLEARKVPVK